MKSLVRLIIILTTVFLMQTSLPCFGAIPEMSPWSSTGEQYEFVDSRLIEANEAEQPEPSGSISSDIEETGSVDTEDMPALGGSGSNEYLGESVYAMPRDYVDHGIPVLSISLKDTTLAAINSGSKEEKYSGNSVKLYEAEQVLLDASDVELKGRGNSTWRGSKKPYQIKFSEKTDILGMGAAKKWVLLANLNDSTHLRNDVALSMAKQVSLNYSFAGQFVDLYVDGEYVGLYYLSHKVEIGSNVINLANPDGILVENDSIHQDTEPRHVSSIEGQFLYLKETKDETYEESALKSFGEAYDKFEADCYAGNWAAVSNEIDTVSFAKYYLLSEVTANPDANHSSFYLYRDGEDDVIHVGPAWDYDLAFGRNGSGIYYDTSRLWSYNDTYNVPDRTTKIFTWLLDIPEFRNLVELVYQNLVSKAIGDQIQTLQTRAAEIRDAGIADNKKWNKKDFDSAVIDLKNWLKARKTFLDYYYGRSRAILEAGDYIICSDEGIISSAYDSSNLLVSESQPTDTRLFTVMTMNNGCHVFNNLQSNKLLYDNNTLKNSEAMLRQLLVNEPSSDSCQWVIIRNDDGTYTIFSKNSSLAVTRTSYGLYTRAWSGRSDQKFRIVKVDDQENGMTSFLQRLYNGCLGRDADEPGLESWKSALYKGATGTQVAVGFLDSREFANLGLNNEEFIQALYMTIFGRSADTSGLTSWLKVLSSGGTRAKVEEGFLNSREMRNMCEEMGVAPGIFRSENIRDLYYDVTAFVVRLYKNCLGRDFDESGLESWVTSLVQGTIGGKDAALGFFASSEMQKQGLSDREFVSVAYRTMLDREPDSSGLQSWINAIKNGLTRDQVINNFAESKEFGTICSRYGIKK